MDLNLGQSGLDFIYIYLLFYIAFNSQGYMVMGSLQVEETSAYFTVNHQALTSNYQLSNMKGPARFEPAESEVGGENSNRYTTDPLLGQSGYQSE